jgi:hypothetical protein
MPKKGFFFDEIVNSVCFCVSKEFLKKFKIFLFFLYLKLIFLDHFDALISKMIFLKNYYFDIFPSKKHYEKQPQPHSQIHLNHASSILLLSAHKSD